MFKVQRRLLHFPLLLAALVLLVHPERRAVQPAFKAPRVQLVGRVRLEQDRLVRKAPLDLLVYKEQQVALDLWVLLVIH